jgi:site-specific DNA-methyltransferase (adenine-specific)
MRGSNSILGLNTIYNEDCLVGMKGIPDNSIDLVITDPPYKLNKTTGGLSITKFNEKWQGNLKASDKNANIMNDIKFSDWLPDVYRVLKENSHCYIWINDKNLSDLQNEAEKVGFRLHNILVWKKNNCTPNKWYMKNCEFILFLHKGKSFPIHNLGDAQFFDCQNINGKDKLHPTQKPIDYLERLIINSSNENEIVFDPFMGSGTTAVACINTNRNFIGFELDPTYCEIAKDRILHIDKITQ